MISSKTVDLVKTFSEEEFRKFGLFINSPYFNKETIQISFYNLLKKYYPDFENRNFEKEKVFAKLYPGKKYNDGVMRNILSSMLELAKNFIATENLQNGEFGFKLALMRELNRRNADKLFEKTAAEAEDLLNRTTAENEQYFYDKFLLYTEKNSNKTLQRSSLYVHEEFLPEIASSLTISFIIGILRINTHLANSNKRLFKLDFDAGIVKELGEYLERESETYKDITYIRFYYNAFKLAKTEDEKYFFALRKIADNEYDRLTGSEKRDIFTVLTNYCYYKINKGELKFRKEQFLIYKENIERGYYKGSAQFLNHILYQNVVITGLEAGEINWAANFIEKYKKELDKNNRENSYNFCRALMFFHEKDYDNALEWAAKVRTDDLSYKHQLKSLYLKVYYDMNETEPFYSHVDSYRHFLSNEKQIPVSTKEILGNYLSFTKKLFDLKYVKNDKEFELMKLRQEIIENKSLVNKHWLLEKTEEITVNKN